MNEQETHEAVGPFDQLVARWPLFWLSLGFIGGIVLAARFNGTVWSWMLVAGLALVWVVGLGVLVRDFHRRLLGLSTANWFLGALVLLAFGLGAARYQAVQPNIDAYHIAWYNDRQYDLLITGVIAAPPDVRDRYTNLRVRVTAVDTGDGDLPADGLVLARVENGETWRYGDVIRLRGALKTPRENEEFSYRDYLARQGIHSYMSSAAVTRLPFPRSGHPFLRWVYDLKEAALAHLYLIFPDPEASLLAGILLGVDNGLTAALQQAFKNTGTAHIIAISGFNIAIIAALFVSLSSRILGPRRGIWAAMAGIVLYTILVGAEASVVRAAIMGGLGLFARQVGRRQTALNTLAFTAAVMCAFNPFMPWDVGFQLSFFATLGLILYADPFHQWTIQLIGRFTLPATAKKIADLLAEYVLFTLAAQLTTLPITAWHFKRVSIVSLIANPFILPAQPLVMILGGLALLFSLLYLPLGKLFAWVTWPFPAYTIRVVEWLDHLPHGVILLGEFSFLFVVLFYAVLFLWTFSRGRARAILAASASPAALLTSLGVAAFLAWNAAFGVPDGRLHLTFLNVGSADAVLLTTPGGRHILINGGPSPSLLASSLGRRLSPLNRSLDWLIVAAPQEEQVAALSTVLERFPAQNVLWAGNPEASYSARRLNKRLAEANIPVTRAAAGYTLDLGYGGRLEVLTVTPRGAVLLITWGEFRALLPIGLNYDALEGLNYGKRVGVVDVLLLADSGYAPLNPRDWMENLQPQVFVLSVAADDEFGLPDEVVLRLTEGRTLLRTDRNGWIEVVTDGKEIWVKVERREG
ncbi:MAG: ComEC/Rec2 family competence protein [Anaerolineales bacterium]|nr:ComEC/Rec2 family competence protein [Anaerolineales bacterium]